jgi:DNA mismatch endonuclease (patch repair protein)
MSRRLWRPPPSRPYRARAPQVTSRMMGAVRWRDNAAERLLRQELWRRGHRYRLHVGDLPGRPDITFRQARVCVFVDGDFWHGRAIVEDGIAAFKRTLRTRRRDWWVAKIATNLRRDRDVSRTLQRDGWRVVRLWESEILRDAGRAADSVVRALTSGRKPSTRR